MTGGARRRGPINPHRMDSLGTHPHARPTRRSYATIALILGMLSVIGIIAWINGKITFISHKKRHTTPKSMEQYFGTSTQCFTPPKEPKDRRKFKGKLKVMNFNAEWLFLFGGRGGIHCPTDACPWGNTAEALEHLQNVADTLVKHDADIIHLSEVEDCRVLRTLLSLMPEDHGYEPYLIRGKDFATGQNAALLTRIDPKTNMIRTEKRAKYPLPDSSCKAGRRGTIGSAKHYIVPIDVENEFGENIPFVFAGIHFLARPTDKTRCAQREAQALVLQNFIRSVSRKDERVIILGDFNDYDPNALGLDGRSPITNALKILYESSGSERKLVNAASLVSLSERYSCWFDVNQNCRVDGDREKVMIDHILFDSTLKVIDSAIHHDWNPTCYERVSDHWPFTVTFEL